MTNSLPPLHGCFDHLITLFKNFCFLLLLIIFSVPGNAAVVLGGTTPGTISDSNAATISHTASTGSYDPATGIRTLPVVVPGMATLTLNVVVQ
jgi:hypothetical protein